MSAVENVLEENRSLRRTMRDLVALSTMPAEWIGLAPDEVSGRLADVLLKKLSVELIYVRLAVQKEQGPVEVLRSKSLGDTTRLEEVRTSLMPLLEPDRVESTATIPDPFGAGTLHVVVTRIGAGGDEGVLVSGSRIAGFPSEQDRVLLTVGANQLFMACQRDASERTRHERHRNVRLAVPQILAQSATASQAAAELLPAVCEGLGWEAGFFWKLESGADALHCLDGWHAPDVELGRFDAASRQRRFQKGEGLPGEAWAKGEPVWLPDVDESCNFPRAAVAASEGLHAAVAWPLLAGRETLGVLELFSQRMRDLDPDLLETMATITGLIGQFMQRKVSEEVLRQSETRFRSLMEQAPFSIQVFAPDGRTIQVNRAWEELWGVKSEQIGTYNILEDRQLEERGVLRYVRQAFAGEPASIPAISYNPDDTIPGVTNQSDPRRWLSAVIFPLKDSGGRLREVVIIHEDITARKRLEGELRVRVTQLRDTDRRKDEFLATLAHELRNPLAPIRNSLQILKMPMVDAATASQTRAMMERQVDHLVRLVDDLLDVSRAMRGKIELRKEQVELATVVARAVETAQPLIEVQQHHLDISLPPESLLLDADPVRLSQVFANLLTNAAKYTEPRGHISLSAGREGNEAFVRVNDDGIGIASDVLPHIFDLFVQVDHATTRSQGGLGIGLTLVKNLVEMHSGRVEAHSSGLGKGSEFLVCLPLLLSQEPDPAEKEESERRQAAISSGCRLLVVDDNKDAATALATLLRLQGHEVRVVHDGISALEAVTAFRPALVLLDIGMPGMDGYEVARRIRQTPGMENVLLAALTGWGQEEDRRRTAEAGFDHHLVKPLQNDALEALLADLKRTDGR